MIVVITYCRLSKDESRLIGALCGLGCDAKSGIPYFPEHDMEMTFDCEIDLDDIVHVSIKFITCLHTRKFCSLLTMCTKTFLFVPFLFGLKLCLICDLASFIQLYSAH